MKRLIVPVLLLAGLAAQSTDRHLSAGQAKQLSAKLQGKGLVAVMTRTGDSERSTYAQEIAAALAAAGWTLVGKPVNLTATFEGPRGITLPVYRAGDGQIPVSMVQVNLIQSGFTAAGVASQVLVSTGGDGVFSGNLFSLFLLPTDTSTPIVFIGPQ